MKKLHEHTRDFRKQPVSKIMSKKGLVKVHKKTHLLELIKLMEEHGVSGFPVVDDKGDFIGDVHERDLLKLAIDPKDLSEFDVVGFLGTKIPKSEFGDLVEDVMKEHDTVVHPDTLIEDVALEMFKEGLRHIPVVKEDAKLEGVLTEETIIESIFDHIKKKVKK